MGYLYFINFFRLYIYSILYRISGGHLYLSGHFNQEFSRNKWLVKVNRSFFPIHQLSSLQQIFLNPNLPNFYKTMNGHRRQWPRRRPLTPFCFGSIARSGARDVAHVHVIPVHHVDGYGDHKFVFLYEHAASSNVVKTIGHFATPSMSNPKVLLWYKHYGQNAMVWCRHRWPR